MLVVVSVTDSRAERRDVGVSTSEHGELGDPVAHRAGADDADDLWDGCTHVSALIPVAARPMISFWICEVPSYRVVTRTSRNYRSTGWSST